MTNKENKDLAKWIQSNKQDFPESLKSVFREIDSKVVINILRQIKPESTRINIIFVDKKDYTISSRTRLFNEKTFCSEILVPRETTLALINLYGGYLESEMVQLFRKNPAGENEYKKILQTKSVLSDLEKEFKENAIDYYLKQ